MNNKTKKPTIRNSKTVSLVKNDWLKDKTSLVALQRNFFVIVSIVSIFGLIIAMITIKSLVEKNAIEPYVISVNTKDNMPVHIKSQSTAEYKDANPQVLEYFITNYIRAREGYSFYTYKYDYKRIVKPMSSPAVYQLFKDTTIDDEKNNPVTMFGEIGRVEVVFKQITHDKQNNIMTVRFAKKIFKSETLDSILNFQVKIHYNINAENIKASDTEINPLGITIDLYSIIEEKTIIEDETVL